MIAPGIPLLLLALAGPPAMVEVDRYRLQSNAWVNLHQRLLHEAAFGTPPPEGLTTDEAATWRAAVEAYRAFVGKRSPIFDEELIAMNAALSRTRGEKPPASIPEAPLNALRAAMPLYERVQWPRDHAVNRFWISLAGPLLASAAPELAAAHARAYGMPLPKQVRVDVSSFAGEFGGYTVGDAASVHTVISSTDPMSQGFAALEMMMHEPSHGIVAPDSGAIGADLARIARETNRKPPWNLWHALLFYTSGELTRRSLAARGVGDYQPVIYRGMFERQFKGFQKPFETHWRALLDGTITRDEAIRKILLETTEAAP